MIVNDTDLNSLREKVIFCWDLDVSDHKINLGAST